MKLALYWVWMAAHDDFRYAVYDYVASMLGVFLLQAAFAASGRTEDARWILSGLLLALAAAALQQRGVGLQRHFNHNDLYHVIQMGDRVAAVSRRDPARGSFTTKTRRTQRNRLIFVPFGPLW